jgi:methionine-rich copper-binding protein CopC
MRQALIRGGVVVGGALTSIAIAAGSLSAHATLVSSDPANGSMLTAAPDHVELNFSENVGKPAAIAVLDQSGNEIDGGELEVVDDTVRRTYDPASFGPGVYTISYQVTSADGHPISGALTFMVHAEGEPVMPAPAVSSIDTTDAEPALVISLAVLLAVGLGAALLIVKRMIAFPDSNPAA